MPRLFEQWAMLLLLGACQRTTALPPIPAPPVVSPQDLQRGADVFATHCVRCHGVQGWGDGPVGGKRVRVQDLGDVLWQSNASNERIAAAILRGGRGVRKSPEMPAFAQFAQDRALLDGLVAYIRSLARTQTQF